MLQENMLKKLLKEFRKHKIVYSLLLIILTLAFFVRIYNLDKFLGFWFDQGRDGLVIWDFWKNGKLFLIGPSTGIMGIFRGPWYYWLITPAYILGRGDPVWPAIFLCFITVVGIAVTYEIGVEIEGPTTGLIAAVISAFSYNLIVAARWLSNPTPMLLIGPLVAWTFIKSVKVGKWWWPACALLIGMALQFGRATDIFFIPTFAVLVFLFRKKIDKKYLFISILAFIIPFIPQVIFDIRHGGILSSSYKSFLFEESGFRLYFWQVFYNRLQLYWTVFTSKLVEDNKLILISVMIVWFYIFAVNFKKLWQEKGFKVLFIIFVSPLLGLLFFQGNGAPVYDYYFTGFYLIFIVLFARVLAILKTSTWGKVLLIILAMIFLTINVKRTRAYILGGPTAITISEEERILDWIYNDAKGLKFNVDVYVPPQIPYAYDYLFKWYGDGIYGYSPSTDQQKLLYSIYEPDLDHPGLLSEWIKKQDKVGKVVNQTNAGPIMVQKRYRYR